jgi:hypothetical protein
MTARIYGDVSLKVYVHPDGSVGSVMANSGDPMLVPAAVASTKQSQFECGGCDGVIGKSLPYSLQASNVPADRCCCTAGHESSAPTAARYKGCMAADSFRNRRETRFDRPLHPGQGGKGRSRRIVAELTQGTAARPHVNAQLCLASMGRSGFQKTTPNDK